MKFSREIYEKLIQLVRSNPCLYDSSADHYKDFTIQRETWMKIASELNENGMNWDDWRRVWKQKRDAFIRKRKELHSNPDVFESTNGKKLSPLFDQFSFLIDHIKGRNASNMADEPQQVLSDGDQSTSSVVTVKDEPADLYIDKDDVESLSPRLESVPSKDYSQRLNEGRESFASRSRNSSANSPSLTITSQIASRKRESEQKLERITEKADSRSTTAHPEPLENPVHSNSENQADEGNVFYFLAKKMKTFSKDTQEWMEDEVLKLYMAAKRREKGLGKY